MLDLLEMLMQDTMDYSWIKERNFYETLGIDVEMGEMKWSDDTKIAQHRANYSRAVFPEKKEAKEAEKTTRPAPRQAPPGMKCWPPSRPVHANKRGTILPTHTPAVTVLRPAR